MRYVNTSSERLIWPRLVNAATGATLELGPGESAEVGRVRFADDGAAVVEDLDSDFEDTILKPASPRRREPARQEPAVPEVPAATDAAPEGDI